MGKLFEGGAAGKEYLTSLKKVAVGLVSCLNEGEELRREH